MVFAPVDCDRSRWGLSWVGCPEAAREFEKLDKATKYATVNVSEPGGNFIWISTFKGGRVYLIARVGCCGISFVASLTGFI